MARAAGEGGGEELKFTRVRLRVKAEMRMGEAVYVVGSHPLLGEWDVKQALQLFTSPETFPMWFPVQNLVFPEGTVVEYKYMVVCGGSFQRYEAIPGNRVIRTTGLDFEVEDVLDEGEGGGAAAAEGGGEALAPENVQGSGVPLEPAPAPTPASHAVEGGGDVIRRSVSAGAARHRRSASDGVAHASKAARARGVAGTAAEVMGQGGRRRSAATRRRAARVATHSASGVALTENDGVVVVVPQLPVLLSHNPNGAWRVVWDEEHLLSRKKPSMHFGGEMRLRVTFVGVPNVHVPPAEQAAVIAALAPFRCKPVFVTRQLQEDAVAGFCKDTLWPLFHNVVDVFGDVPTRWWNRERQAARWQAYMELNRLFADTVVEAYNEGDLVWIHDYHLLLLPSVLARRRLRSSNIGLFLHAPFPSSEIFRTLSVRDDLLRGMLNADHIGFHLFEYARHFLACCRRILGLEHSIQAGGRIALHSHGRDVLITVCHAGIEPLFVSHRLATDEVAEFRRSLAGVAGLPEADAAPWSGGAAAAPVPTPPATPDAGDGTPTPTPTPRALYASRGRGDVAAPREGEVKVIVGLDSLERLKGLPLKLLAFAAFLEEHPAWVPHVRLLQVGVFDKSREADCTATAEEVATLVRHINERFAPAAAASGTPRAPLPPAPPSALTPGGSGAIPPTVGAEEEAPAPPSEGGGLLGPLVYYVQRQGGMSLSERLGLFRLGHVHFSAAFRDGLNLSPLEFVSAAPGGVVVVSEFSSCARMLPGAMRVNPWKVSGVAHALARAVSMRPAEATARRDANVACLGDNTTSLWAERVLLDLKAASQAGGHRTYMGYGLGLKFRQLGFESNFAPLNVEAMLGDYQRTSRRLFLLDYAGTLQPLAPGGRPWAKGYGVAPPAVPPGVLASLRALAQEPRNTVVVLSGKERGVLEAAFASCPELCLAAEHGFFFSIGATPGPLAGAEASGSPAPDGRRRWAQLGEHFDDSWMDVTAVYMEGYAARTNGTYVSRKSSSMLWHYADADGEFGRLQAKELVDHLTGTLKHFPVEVFQGPDNIEVRPRGVSKGAIAAHFIDLLEGRVAAGQVSRMEQANAASAGVGAEAVQAEAATAISSALARRHRRRSAAGTPLPAAGGDALDSDMHTTDLDTDAGGVASPAAAARPQLRLPRPATGTSSGTRTPGGTPASSVPRRTRRVDFLLCVGDDKADESMFSLLAGRAKGLQAARGRGKERRRGTSSAAAAVAASATAMAGRSGGTPASDTASRGSTPAGSPSQATGGGDAAPPPPQLGSGLARPSGSGGGAGMARSRSHGKHLGGGRAGRARARGGRGVGGVGFMLGSSVLQGHAGSVASLSSTGSGTSLAGAGKGAPPPAQFTVIVGKKPSAAQFFLEDAAGVADMLRGLAKVATRSAASRSMTDLTFLAPGAALLPSTSAVGLALPQMPGELPLTAAPGGPLPPAALPAGVPRVLHARMASLSLPPRGAKGLSGSASMSALSELSGAPLLAPLAPLAPLGSPSAPPSEGGMARSATAGNLADYLSSIAEVEPPAF